MSFASISSESAAALKKGLEWVLSEIAARHSIDISAAPSLEAKLKSLIMKLAVTNKVVILIDEYDYSILRNIEDVQVANECRDVLSDFFSALKDVEVDKCLRFVFITGISKFSRTSIFSGLNNLLVLSLEPRAAQLLGYTAEEIQTSFRPHLENIARQSATTVEHLMGQLQFWYNGYRFAAPIKHSENKVYNPFSVLLYLSNGTFDNYWFASGTPTFLLRLIKMQQFPVAKIEGSEVNIDETKSYDIEKITLVPLLWQTGYLSIESYNPDTKNYKLAFPNEEVKESFFNFFMHYLTETPIALIANASYNLTQTLKNEDLQKFFETLRVFFAQIPYSLQLSYEKYYQSIFFIILKMIGADIDPEELTNNERIDAVIQTKHEVWIFEFKLNNTAQAALAQIEEKQYYQKYLDLKKTIKLIGVEFDTETRNIKNWIVKELK